MMDTDAFHRTRHRIIMFLSERPFATHEEIKHLATESVIATYSPLTSNRKWVKSAKEFIKDREKQKWPSLIQMTLKK